MENVIELRNVSKAFPGFQLKNLSLNVKRGFVTGFIGANGAGKTTTIKLMMNLMQPDEGEVKLFGLNYREHEKEIKERIGFVYDSNVFYDTLTLHEMKKIIASAYRRWDEKMFQYYAEKFALPMKKKMRSFSKGMKMKASLAFALSHHAELIIMDEPTAELDPVFRRELLEMLHELMADGKKTIFFSTHITTDLDRIADYIAFIQDGKLVFMKEFYKIGEEYAIVKGAAELLDADTEKEFIAIRKTNAGFEALTGNIERVKRIFGDEVLIEKATLEDIMYYSKRGVVHV